MAERRPSADTDRRPSVHPWVFNGIVVLVSLVWAASFVIDALPGAEYEPPVAIHGAFVLVLGAVFGVRIARGGE